MKSIICTGHDIEKIAKALNLPPNTVKFSLSCDGHNEPVILKCETLAIIDTEELISAISEYRLEKIVDG